MTAVHFTKMMTIAALMALPVTAAAQGGTAPAQRGKPATAQPAKPAAKQPAKAPAGRARGTATTSGLSAAAKAKLKNPAALKDVAPAEFRASFDTSVGTFVVLVRRNWAPKAADRFYNLVKYGFFDGNRFFRVLPNFMVQFGMNGDPSIQGPWMNANITDEPITQSNKRGTMTFANAGPNTRSSQVFINFKDNSFLDDRFAPFGQIESGMEAVDKINAQYGETPRQNLIQTQGNAYLTRAFPALDYVKKATIVKPPAPVKPRI